ncbi:MFS transporter [Clostridioides difficile]|nr:MFS transporter [Clostridioides difficile]MCA0682780.1 MFS transporter [Clostridioides difficile]MCP3316119.1 MFS transporter [Clostridioides difficile]MDN9066361.1 MFS transporter [Clostridioides difficile]MDN9167184.1 MFS transporter [Clostridioides difficile]
MKLSWQRKLLIFMTSQTVSMLGSSIVSLSLIWYVTLQTNSGIAITGITITTFLPQALIMLVGGVIADRFPLKKIIMLSDSFIALSTLCLAVIYASGNDSILWIYVFNSLRSIGSGIQIPATKSILPSFIPQEELMRANSYSTTTWSIIQLISPALAGIALSFFSLSVVLMLDFITAVIGILLLLIIPIKNKERHYSKNGWLELKQGVQYLTKSTKLRTIISLYTLFNILVVPASQLTPLLASTRLDGDVWILTCVEMAFSIGALLGSLYLGYKKITISHMKLVGYSICIFGLSMGLLIYANSIWLFALFMLIMGIGSPLYYTPIITMVQEYSDPTYIGRMFSYVDLFGTLATPLGMMIFAPLSSINLDFPFILPSIALLLLGIWTFKKAKLFKNIQ